VQRCVKQVDVALKAIAFRARARCVRVGRRKDAIDRIGVNVSELAGSEMATGHVAVTVDCNRRRSGCTCATTAAFTLEIVAKPRIEALQHVELSWRVVIRRRAIAALVRINPLQLAANGAKYSSEGFDQPKKIFRGHNAHRRSYPKRTSLAIRSTKERMVVSVGCQVAHIVIFCLDFSDMVVAHRGTIERFVCAPTNAT
jgi:hypothetical protein